MEAIYVIILITLGLSALIRILQRKLVDRKKVKELQKQLKEDNKRYFELIKEAEKNKKEIDEIHPRIMKAQMDMMNSSMKVSLITLPAFLVVLYLLKEWFMTIQLVSPIPVIMFVNWIPVGLTTTPGYYEAYISFSILSTILLIIIEKIYDIVRHPELALEKKREDELKKKEKNKLMDKKADEVKN
ncbi:MAG: EMC3/TMCO1 family protein [archaeon]